MDETRPQRRKMRSYTVAALLGLFVVAALVALAGRFLPGSLSCWPDALCAVTTARILEGTDRDRGIRTVLRPTAESIRYATSRSSAYGKRPTLPTPRKDEHHRRRREGS